MKGSSSVNPMFESLDIKNPIVFSIEPLIATDNHRLYFKSGKTSIKWEHKSIINCSYTRKYGAILILCQDGKLYVFTENLNEIARIPWESKYSVGLQLIEKYNMFLMIGATEVQLQYVKINSNIRTNKFVSSMVFGVQKRDKYIAEPDTKLQWNKGYSYNLKQNLLYLWSSKDINFYSLDKLQLKSHIVSLTKKQLSMTYVFYNTHYKYTVTGLINGHIKVWRLPQNSSSKDYILIHNFIKHTKPIDKIVEGHDERIIISSSSEMIVCLWSLQTFDLLRQYNFLGEYNKIILKNSIYSLSLQDSILGRLNFGKTMEFITQISSNLIFQGKYYENNFLPDKKVHVDSVQLTLASNIGFQIRDEHLDAKDLNKIDVEWIYPPLKAKGIQQIIASPYSKNQYFLLVENGQIFRVRIEDGSGKIEEAYAIQRAKDIQFHQLNQNPTIIKFLSIVPPKFDSQINQNTLEKRKADDRPFLQKFMDLQLLTVGCNKGTVAFFKIYDFQFIFTRVTYHREEITHLESFNSQGSSYIATFCLEHYFRLVKFDEEKATCIFTHYLGPCLRQCYGFEDRLAIVFQKGFFDIFQLDENDATYCIRNMETSDHEDEIWSLDYDTNRKLILTSAGDNKIKIWTYYKVLVYEVFLDEGLKETMWFRDCEILVSHNLKILYFKNIGLKITDEEIEEYNNEFLMTHQDRYSLKEVALMMKEAPVTVEYIEKQPYSLKKVREKEKVVSFDRLIETEIKPKRKVEKSFQESPKRKNNKSGKSKTRPSKTTEEQSKRHAPDNDLQLMRKHIEEMKDLKKQTNESLLPKIKPKVEDSFDTFMKSKLINKKVLTRRDITLNRIIMKNIIKDHFGNDNQVISNLKLDF